MYWIVMIKQKQKEHDATTFTMDLYMDRHSLERAISNFLKEHGKFAMIDEVISEGGICVNEFIILNIQEVIPDPSRIGENEINATRIDTFTKCDICNIHSQKYKNICCLGCKKYFKEHSSIHRNNITGQDIEIKCYKKCYCGGHLVCRECDYDILHQKHNDIPIQAPIIIPSLFSKRYSN